MQQCTHFFPRDASPYSTPVAKAMALPNRVVMEKLRKTGNSAILREGSDINVNSDHKTTTKNYYKYNAF